jgi:hypothetical protein
MGRTIRQDMRTSHEKTTETHVKQGYNKYVARQGVHTCCTAAFVKTEPCKCVFILVHVHIRNPILNIAVMRIWSFFFEGVPPGVFHNKPGDNSKDNYTIFILRAKKPNEIQIFSPFLSKTLPPPSPPQRWSKVASKQQAV